MLTAVSLFAGVGGFDLALERNGVKVVASVEIDKHASKVLARHFPNSQLFNDVKEVTGEQLRAAGFIGERGIITGGFPCQDLSVAGRREGLAGQRSGLFWEICRLLDETHSRYFILENVPGLLSSQQGRDMGAVTAALSSRGYSVAWRTLDAQHFGVPQRRRRVFIVGSLGDDWRAPSEILALAEGRRGYLAASNAKRKDTARTAASSSRSGSELLAFRKSKRAQSVEDDETWVPDEVTNTINTFDLGDTRTTEVITAIQNTTIGRSDTAGPNGRGFKDVGEPMFTLDTTEPHAVAITPIQDAREVDKKQNGLGIGNEGDPSYTVDTLSHQAVAISRPTLFEATRVDDSRFYEDYSPTVASYWGTGGARVPYVVRDGVESLTPWPEMGEAMRVYGENGVAPIVKQHQTNVLQASTVRRLTPRECERLQGFPDDWTAGQADSHRYKQMGNAVAVPVVEWIVRRLVAKAGS